MKIGDILQSNSFGAFEVLLVNKQHCMIKFTSTGTEIFATTGNAKNGRVKDKFMPNVHGVGFIGYGKHKSTSPSYIVWSGMMSRCYCKENKSYATYGLKGASVCSYWHNFQNFADWHLAKLKEAGAMEKPEIDKDSIKKGNLMYSPSMCVILTKSANISESSTRIKSHNSSGYIGVNRCTKKGRNRERWQARATVNGKRINCGFYDSAIEAHNGRLKCVAEQIAKNNETARKVLKGE